MFQRGVPLWPGGGGGDETGRSPAKVEGGEVDECPVLDHSRHVHGERRRLRVRAEGKEAALSGAKAARGREGR